MITETAEGARSRIRAWNDGVYRHTVFLDTTGAEAGLIRVPLALVKEGDHLTIDLSGTSPEHEGSFQALAASTRAHCAVNLYPFPFHDFPVSAGMLEPIDFVIPHGTILDPDTEAAISCSPLAASAVFPLLAVTFSKMMFDSDQRSQVCGFASSNSSAPMISAVNQHGVRITDFMGYPLNAWGLSARSDSDGVDVFGFPHGPWGKAAGRRGHRERVPGPAPVPEDAAEHVRVRPVARRRGRGDRLRHPPRPLCRLDLDPEGGEAARRTPVCSAATPRPSCPASG